MNLLFKNVHKSPSLIAFTDYRESEARNELQTSVSNSGELLEYETLELRVNPPNIDIDNNYDPTCTLITVDSANRPGTLVEASLPAISANGKVACQDLASRTIIYALPGCPALYRTGAQRSSSPHIF